MDFNELIKQATTIVEEDYDYDTWKTLTTNVLADLNPVAKILSTVLIDVELVDGEAFIHIDDISLSLFEVVSVSFKPHGERSRMLKRIAQQNTVSMGYYRKYDEICLRNIPYESGQVEINYYELLTIDENDEFNLPDKYHEVLLKGVMAMAMQKEEELDRRHDFMNDYMIAKRQMQAERVIEMEPWFAPLVAPTTIGGV